MVLTTGPVYKANLLYENKEYTRVRFRQETKEWQMVKGHEEKALVVQNALLEVPLEAHRIATRKT